MGLLGFDFLVLIKFSNPALGNEEKIMHGEKTYPEVMHHYSLGNPIISIRSKPIVLPSSGELHATIPGCDHHT
jgi:hypothetical protein